MLFLLLPLVAPRRDTTTWAGFAILAGSVWVPAILAAVWDYRSRIVADEVGLRWRGMGRWKSAPWADLEDYHLLPIQAHPDENAVLVVRTRGGTVHVAPSGWTHVTELRRVISARAANGPADGWAPLGARRQDGDSAVFPYGARLSRLAAAFVAICGLVIPLLWLPVVSKPLTEVGVGGPEAAALTAIALLVSLLLLAMALPISGLSLLVAWQWWRHSQEVIEVTPGGLSWRKASEQRFIPWDEVVEYGCQRERLPGILRYVRGESGETIQFQPFLHRVYELQAMIQRLAIGAESSSWVLPPAEILGGPRLRWRGSARVYHYRTRSTRVLLWIAGTLAAAAWVPYLARYAGNSSIDALTLAFTTSLAGVISAAFIGLLLCYYRGCVLVDPMGITGEWPLGRKRLAWSAVRRYGTRRNQEEGFRFVAGECTTLWFSPSIGDLEELQREISTRAPQAEGSWPTSDESLPVTAP